MKPLPIGIQTFRDLVEGGYLYIDKTKNIFELIKNTKGAYFLSRPRRFGKSLLLSVLDDIFSGNKELFQGLWLYDSEYNWKKHPVIRLDLSKQKAKEPEVLKGFFTVLKGNDAHTRFLLLTGVSKFSKAGVFSNLNHLKDITLNDNYSSLLGITDEELRENFPDYIAEFAEKENLSKEALIDKIRFWYNGYRFSAEGKSVYNPFSTLLLFDSKRFEHHWFETGTPEFLVKLMLKNQYDLMEVPLHLDAMSFSSYEVKKAFLSYFTRKLGKKDFSDSILYSIVDALADDDIETCIEVLRKLFLRIEYDLHIPQEKYYQTLFFLVFTLLGFKISTEVKTNIGRIDAVIDGKSVYIFCFVKTDCNLSLHGTKEEAFAQIKTKKYYEKYITADKSIYLIGAEFKDRNIGEYVAERI